MQAKQTGRVHGKPFHDAKESCTWRVDVNKKDRTVAKGSEAERDASRM